jgi:CheY-like chemotaxis protein
MEQKRALIVDDTATNARLLALLLRRLGLAADCCSSGAEAVSLVREAAYDIIFMDHLMPDMDGIETARCIRSLSRTDGDRFKTVPIVAVSAAPREEVKRLFPENGFNDYLIKPIDYGQLEAITRRLVLPERPLA